MQEIFKGAATALITPFDEKGAIDWDALERLIDFQISSGIDGLVIAGTTGEGSTLDDAEHKALLDFAIKAAGGLVPMIAGTGSNDTAYARQLTAHANELGYDACLVVTPYYNKTTQTGLVAMFESIAEVSEVPLIVYNIPGRTGVNVEPQTFVSLAENPKICAIKEASGNIGQVVDIFGLVGDKMSIYSGNDDQIVPLLSLGGSGVISVLSNLMPRETAELCHAYFEGRSADAARAQLAYLPLIHALFGEVNPIPVKCAMAHMGFGANNVRLPLVPLSSAHEATLLAEMRALGLIEE